MNSTIELLLNRKSVRAYSSKPVSEEEKQTILNAAMRSPTAGNMMLYSIIEVKSEEAKKTLSKSCDNQPFIAKAPLVLLFLADYQRWYDYFLISDVEALCRQKGETIQKPEEADLMLACCDALIAAQTAVIAAESIGIGSCYIGDIMENYETHQRLFDLPRYVFPICLLCLGYPTQQQTDRTPTGRFPKECVVFEDRYRKLTESEFAEMFTPTISKEFGPASGIANFGKEMYLRKFAADFTIEMRSSARKIFRRWNER